MIDWAMRQWANPFIAIVLYWLPLVLCFVGYFIRTFKNYRKDLKARATAEVERRKPHGEYVPERYYDPTDTVGSLIGRGLVIVMPIANLFACVFDLGPMMFRGFFKWIGRVFDQPLVPKRDK